MLAVTVEPGDRVRTKATGDADDGRELQPELRRRGALFVAISPQTSRQNDFTLQQHALPFPLLSDAGASVAESG